MAVEDHVLIKIARQSIEYGLIHHKAGVIRRENLSEKLLGLGASFVTLYLDGKLRGCIGSVKANCALAQDVATNAYLAAFQDRRFSPLTQQELSKVKISISLLSELEPIDFDDESELLEIIRPNIDGLVLQEHEYRGVFLPIVWQTLPSKRDFLNALKQKAGLTQNYWSDALICWRFTTRLIQE